MYILVYHLVLIIKASSELIKHMSLEKVDGYLNKQLVDRQLNIYTDS